MKKLLTSYIGWTYPCEKDHLAFKEESKHVKQAYKNNLNKLKSNLDYRCPCDKWCKPIKVEIIVREIK